MIDQVHQNIQEDEAAWEERVRLAFLGIQQNESVTVSISTDPAGGEKGDEVGDDEGGLGERTSFMHRATQLQNKS